MYLRKIRSSTERRQAAPELLAFDHERVTDVEEEPTLKALMAMMGKINNRMATYETRLSDISAVQAPFTATAEPSTSR